MMGDSISCRSFVNGGHDPISLFYALGLTSKIRFFGYLNIFNWGKVVSYPKIDHSGNQGYIYFG